METNRKTTVMFASFIGTSSVVEAAGDDAAQNAIARCFERIGGAATSCGGRLIKTMHDKSMILVATPDGAADAAVAIHTAVSEFPAVSAVKLGLGIGFHYGPVIQKETDVFGDTVNLAARLGEQAAKGQIITTLETGELFSPIYRPWMRKLGTVDVKGRSDQVEICELVWRADDSATLVAKRRTTSDGVLKLKLKYRGGETVRRREKDAVVIGREHDCGLVVDDDQVSRHHCTIERRGDKFVLTDTSSNGTYVTIQGEAEVLLQREELTLSKRGWIAFGQPRVAAKEAVEFICYT
ncbi:MAG TPA: adenylate/guanylate cyclase domain-containing protein [Burkholderiales bacterium]|nr:adenylate/guanylate cyclase domain-containing protein [Burkholderiales bacterium]